MTPTKTQSGTPRGLTIFLALALTVALSGAAGSARADEARDLAKQHFAAGESKFKAGDYRGAIVEFEAADALVPSPILSYNIGLAHEKLGEHETAVARYKDYLNRRPDAPNRAQVEGRIHSLEDAIAAARAPKPEPQPAPKVDPKPVTPDLDDPKGGGTPAEPKQPTLGPGSKGGWVDPDPAQPRPLENMATDPNDTIGAEDPSAMGTLAEGVDPALARRVPKRMARVDGALGMDPSASAGGPAERAPDPAVPDAPATKKVKPVYKEWWFWVVVGVSAVIVVSMFDNGGNNNAADAPSTGAVLFRF